MTQLFGAVGQCVLAGMIYFIRDWRLAQLITAAPFAVISIYIWCALPLFITFSCFKGNLSFIQKFHGPCLSQVYSRVSQMVVGQRKDRRG